MLWARAKPRGGQPPDSGCQPSISKRRVVVLEIVSMTALALAMDTSENADVEHARGITALILETVRQRCQEMQMSQEAQLSSLLLCRRTAIDRADVALSAKFLNAGGARPAGQCASSQLLAARASTFSGTLMRNRRHGRVLHDRDDHRHGSPVDLGVLDLEDQFVMHLQQHAGAFRSPAFSSAGSMRIMARRMMSAAEPWIGALIEARSLKARTDGLDDLISG